MLMHACSLSRVALYGTHLVTVASIAGDAVAGGCILSLACDTRVISSEAKIGLNEAAFGLIAPPWTVMMMIDTIGRRQAEKALSLGTIFTASDAYTIGLVDRVVQSFGDADTIVSRVRNTNEEAEAEALAWSKPPGRTATKSLLRSINLSKLMSPEDRADDLKMFKDCVIRPEMQKMLGGYLASLSKKKK